ncbi:MAG: hypothetical protein AAGI28_10485 [Pseudomonadota bacterium]
MAACEQVRSLKITGLVFGALSLSGCAIATPATLTSASPSTRNASQSFTSIELLSETEEAGLRAQLLEELKNSLENRAVTVQKGAEFIGDYSVSTRPAELGLQTIEESSESSETTDSGFTPRWYHKCEPNRVSASLVIYSRANGTVLTKSSGEFLACPDDLAELRPLADLLVDSIVGN